MCPNSVIVLGTGRGEFENGIDCQLDFVKGGRFRFNDFSKIGILLDPISKSPGGEAEIPVSINFIDMPELIVVKVKSIFEFLETVFNPPTEQIVCNNHFGRRVEFVGKE